MSYVGHTFTTDVGKECEVVAESKEYIRLLVRDLWLDVPDAHWSIPKKHFEAVTGEQLFFHQHFEQKQVLGEQIELF